MLPSDANVMMRWGITAVIDPCKCLSIAKSSCPSLVPACSTTNIIIDIRELGELLWTEMSACDFRQKAAQRWSSHTANEAWSNCCVCCLCAWHALFICSSWHGLVWYLFSFYILHFSVLDMCLYIWSLSEVFSSLKLSSLVFQDIRYIILVHTKNRFSCKRKLFSHVWGPLWNISSHIDCFIEFALRWSEARSHFSCSRKSPQ